MRPRNVYKDILNNMVSLIDHVFIITKIILELIAYETIFATVFH
jgi:hypothetical protein